MASLWSRGEELAEICKVDGTWQIRTESGDVLMRGWREALESFLRLAGWTAVE